MGISQVGQSTGFVENTLHNRTLQGTHREPLFGVFVRGPRAGGHEAQQQREASFCDVVAGGHTHPTAGHVSEFPRQPPSEGFGGLPVAE